MHRFLDIAAQVDHENEESEASDELEDMEMEYEGKHIIQRGTSIVLRMVYTEAFATSSNEERVRSLISVVEVGDRQAEFEEFVDELVQSARQRHSRDRRYSEGLGRLVDTDTDQYAQGDDPLWRVKCRVSPIMIHHFLTISCLSSARSLRLIQYIFIFFFFFLSSSLLSPSPCFSSSFLLHLALLSPEFFHYISPQIRFRCCTRISLPNIFPLYVIQPNANTSTTDIGWSRRGCGSIAPPHSTAATRHQVRFHARRNPRIHIRRRNDEHRRKGPTGKDTRNRRWEIWHQTHAGRTPRLPRHPCQKYRCCGYPRRRLDTGLKRDVQGGCRYRRQSTRLGGNNITLTPIESYHGQLEPAHAEAQSNIRSARTWAV